MPSRVASGTSGSHGKIRYRSKHFHRKSNSNAPKYYTRRQDIPPSNSDRRAPVRSSLQERSVAQINPPPPSRYNQRKSWVGIFGAEREHGNITILRRQDADKPKGNVPSWLADTFGSLPKKHPLNETANHTGAMESMTLDPDDDDNPFAYQPPSPSQIPSTTQDAAFPYFAQREPARSRGVLSHRMGPSLVPFAPPTFVEPTYEDQYQDMTMPLNDFDCDYEPEHTLYLANHAVDDQGQGPGPLLPAPRATPQLTTIQEMSSPVFLSRGYPSSPIAATPEFDTISSDDITLPTPIHNNVLTPETDEIQDALRANHPFVTSMYASSPTGSFGGFPLNALVRSREPSPHDLISSSRNMATPDVIRRKVWTPRKKLFPRLHVQSPPPLSDVYKSRLLAYATTIADHMSSSGDESLAGQGINECVDLPGTEFRRNASSPGPVTQNSSFFGPLNDRALTTLHQSPEPLGAGNDHSVMTRLYVKALDPDNRIERTLATSLAVGRLDHAAAGTYNSAPEFGASDHTRNELDHTDLDDSFDLADTYLEDWKGKAQSEGVTDGLEEEYSLLSEYEAMQAEYDVLAADEPSDDEDGPTEQHQVTTSQRNSQVEHQTLEVDRVVPTIPETSEPNPKIQPFPMKVTHRSPARDIVAPAESQPALTRLSPKFVTQPSRRVQPSPFTALLKKRFKVYSNAVGSKDQDNTEVVEDDEDVIEYWPG